MLSLRFALPLVALAGLTFADSARAQSCCAPAVAAPAPTVAYSPVVAQTTQVTPWYPGRNIIEFTRDLFAPRVTTGTVVTAGYAPTVAPVAAPALQTTYRPVYPVTYGPVTTARTFVARPVIQTVARPVVLSPVQQVTAMSPCCDPCSACSTCGVSQAVYDAPLSTGCSSCASGGVSSFDTVAPTTAPSTSRPLEPRPALGPEDNPPADRSIFNRPEVPPLPEEADEDAAESGAFWEAPPLFDPKDRLTRRNPAPVWFAGGRSADEDRETPVVNAGWISASR